MGTILEFKGPEGRTVDLSAALSAAKMAAWTYDVGTRSLLRSSGFNVLLGLAAGAAPTLEEIVARLAPGERDRIVACIQKMASGAETFFRIDFRIRRFDGEVRWFLLRAETVRDDRGQLSLITGVLIDLTDRKTEELENAYLASVVASTPYAVISIDVRRHIASWNEGAVAAFGYTKEEALGQPVQLIIPEESRARADEIMTRAFSGETLTAETERIRKGGVYFPVKVTAAPVRGPDGSVIGISAVYEDRTEAKASKEKQELLVRELHHRVRNTLATVQGIAGLTAGVSSSIEEFRDSFTRRIAALAQTHYRLTEATGQRICISDLIEQELGPFVTNDRVTQKGPRVALSSQVAPTLAMVIHELATNAVKHGSLRNHDGAIEITWETVGDKVRFHWAEHGALSEPKVTRRGFGTTLLDHVAPAQFGSEVIRSFEPDGLRLEISLPFEPLPPLP
jgi:PAS domain S-box-containing protein